MFTGRFAFNHGMGTNCGLYHSLSDELRDWDYDSEPHREELRQKGIEPFLAKRRTENGSGLGVFRWVVERTLSWLHQFRRLRVRYERRSDIHEAFVKIGCILIWHNVL